MTLRKYEVWVYNTDVLSSQLGSTTNVDTIFTVSDLSQAPTIPGPDVSPLEGKAVGQPWTVNVLDSTGKASAMLADSGGRADILRRFGQILVSDDGSTFKPIGGGRLADVADTYPGYDITFNHELLNGYFSDIFTTNTCWVFPPAGVWGGHVRSTNPPGQVRVGRHGLAANGVNSTLFWGVAIDPGPIGHALQSGVLGQIEGDLDEAYDPVSTEGSFNHLRLNRNLSCWGRRIWHERRHAL